MPRDALSPRACRRPLPRPVLAAAAALFLGLAAPAARAHDYPTLDRVRFVQECMREHPGSAYEMTNKCVCAIDRIAEQLPYDEFVSGWTAANAISIGGERGSYIRDTEVLQVEIKRYRALVAESKKACFIR